MPAVDNNVDKLHKSSFAKPSHDDDDGTSPIEDYWKFRRGLWASEAKLLKESMKLNWSFLSRVGGGEPTVGVRVRISLEEHSHIAFSLFCKGNI